MTMLSPDLSSEELNTGYCRSAVTQALIMKASIVSLKPCFSVSTVWALRKASRSVMSASSNCVTCGIEIHLRLARHRTRGRSRSDRRRGRRGRRRLGGSGLWRLGKRLVLRLEHKDRRIPGNLVADLDPDLLHHAGSGGGNFHRRLVRLEGDQRLLLGDRVAGLHQQLDDLDLLEIADIGHGNGQVAGRLGLRFLLGSLLCAPGPFLGIELEDRRALRHLVAHLYLQFLDHAGRRRRYLHRRLVRLQRDQRLLLGNGVARLDEYLDDLDFLEVADVRNDHLTHTVVGSGLSASMPYFLSASATVFGLPSP